MRFQAISAYLAVFVVGVTCTTASASAATFEVFAEGLDNARGLTFGPDGLLYVTELDSGSGSELGRCLPSSTAPGMDLCLGNTGALTRIDANGVQEKLLTGLPSIALGDGFEGAGPQDIEMVARLRVIGPRARF